MIAAPHSSSAAHSSADSQYFSLDAQTTKDLEVFESEAEGMSLFEFCNFTRTQGGATALRRRMERPWCDANRIRATQESLSYILERRDAFAALPSAYATSRAEHYTHESLPTVQQDNLLEFTLGALLMRANNGRQVVGITHGVQVTCGMIRGLRRLVSQPELASPIGELAPLFDELRNLLARPKLAAVPNQEVGGWIWRILRLDQVYRRYEIDSITRLLQIIYEIDALVAMADVTEKQGFALPRIEEGSHRVHAEGLVHPLVHNAVANPVQLDQERRVLFLTGPNMAGKTTYLRAFATAVYFAHLGMGVPAKSLSFVPAQRLFSAISLSDDLHGGISYFRAEALRVKAIGQAIADGYRVVAILDEPFKGTNVKDALDASLAILERFAARKGCLFMFSSHLIELSESLSVTNQIDCRHFEAEEGEGRLRFDYQLHPGVSNQRLGMRVLQEEGVFDLLDG